MFIRWKSLLFIDLKWCFYTADIIDISEGVWSSACHTNKSFNLKRAFKNIGNILFFAVISPRMGTPL